MDQSVLPSLVMDHNKRLQFIEEKLQKHLDIILPLKDENISLSKRVLSLEENEAKNASIIKTLKSLDENKKQKIISLGNEVIDLSKQIDHLENNAKTTEDSVSALQRENEELSRRIESLERENSTLAKKQEEWTEKKNKNTDLIETLRIEIDTLKSSTTKYISRVNRLEDDMEEAGTKLSKAMEDLDQKTKSVIALQQQLNSFHVTLQQRKEAMERQGADKTREYKPFYARMDCKQTRQIGTWTTPQVNMSASHKFDGDFLHLDPSTSVVTVTEDGVFCFGWWGQQDIEGEIAWVLDVDGNIDCCRLGMTRCSWDVCSGMVVLPLKQGQKVRMRICKRKGEARVCYCNLYGWCLYKTALGHMASHQTGLNKYLDLTTPFSFFR